MPASVAIPALVGGLSAGSSAFGAYQQSSASKEAARIAASTADKELAEQRRIFDIQRSDRQPYVNASLGALGQAQALTNQGSYMQLPAQQLGASSPGSRPMPPMNMGSLGQTGQPSTPQSPQGGEQPTGMFRAPDGETRTFPLSMEQELAGRGVRRVQ